MTRAELAWFLVLGAFIAWVILGTLKNEMMEVRERMANDTIEHLAGMLSHSLEAVDTKDLPLPSAGPGKVPDGLRSEVRSRLSELLPDHAHIPTDPWGGAYVLLRVFDSPDADHLMILSAGPEGVVRELDYQNQEFVEFLTFPRRR